MGSVLITGGTGFIGSHIVEAFCQKGIKAGCLVRKNSNFNNIKHLPVKLEYGDIEDVESLIDIFKNYNFIIHVAALAGDWGCYEKFYNINVEGTLNVLKACKENNIEDIIITSSISVYGEENSEKIKDENSPHKSHYPYFLDDIFPCGMNYYRNSKALAKEKAIAFSKENNQNLTIIEPVWVYGEREFNTGFYEYLKTASAGVPLFPGSKKNKFHVIYAKDLARAYLLAYEKKLKGINSFIIGNRKVQLMDEIYKVFCDKAKIKKPRTLPKSVVYPLGFLMELFYALFRIKSAPLLTRGRVNMLYDSIEYSTKKAEEILGFVNEYNLEEGIEKTVKWYKNNGYI
ncbi:NAD-dependent epimerase/dehydratase family protein [Herbivorax sp. ANBcel31]|uniref:NAD-dependent epimerase/dehydratase family protein n=1 Tax=Herbivorax sp. ANBcel31 TaxID=3069754 RepID=UPI0027B33F15|nr:NAD-dependent epimerase/dehydratase family protein [Herbivorax sp. ANBcel31]MDQ2087529.1 NAD-dependent epimerase/dehydratase family protein [Herbivorax sp. ANBcel31]